MLRPMLRSFVRWTMLIVALLALTAGGSAVRAQDSTEESEATKRAKEEQAQADADKAKADARKAAAEAARAEFEAKFPKPTSSPLAGTTTINDAAIIESMMVSYISMAKAANKIVDTIGPKLSDATSLVIYNEKDANLRLSYKVANNQIDIIENRYCALLSPSITNNICGKATTDGAAPPGAPETAPLGIAQSFLGAFVDLTALLRTNVEIKGQTFDIDEGPLVAEVFRAARRETLGLPASVRGNLYYPFVFPPVLKRESAILARLEQLHTLRVGAGQLIGDIERNGTALTEIKNKITGINNSQQNLQDKVGRAEGEANNLLRVYCPSLFAKPGDLADKLDIVGTCRRLPAETHKRLLDLKDTILDLRGQLKETSQASDSATMKQTELKDEKERLRQKLHSTVQDIPDDAVAQLKATNDQFDSFVGSLIKADAATGLNPLTSFIRIENLLPSTVSAKGTNEKPEKVYWLQLKVVKAGGNNRIKTNLIVDIFTGGNRLSHSGGAIVQYHLFDNDGRSVLSDTIADYTKYIKTGSVPSPTNSSPSGSNEKEATQVDVPEQ
jgi:hypothetical protein